jgi:hypothetical protein
MKNITNELLIEAIDAAIRAGKDWNPKYCCEIDYYCSEVEYDASECPYTTEYG